MHLLGRGSAVCEYDIGRNKQGYGKLTVVCLPHDSPIEQKGTYRRSADLELHWCKR